MVVNKFYVKLAVPGDVDSAKDPETTYKHGVMTIAFDKSPKVLPKKIQIKRLGE